MPVLQHFVSPETIIDLAERNTQQGLASGAARGWFFLRFSDPRPHLRLRLRHLRTGGIDRSRSRIVRCFRSVKLLRAQDTFLRERYRTRIVLR